MKDILPSRKKPSYPVNEKLSAYLDKFNRNANLPLDYNELLRFNNSTPLFDFEGKDTDWEIVYYPDTEREELYSALTLIYAFLKTDGDMEVLEHLTVSRVDFCIFGNSQPFRVRIINRLNDNYDHFYVKKADASRIYGLELEELLSPNHVRYLVDGETLIEEHIAGIPGDDFFTKYLPVDTEFNQTRIAKEFVKFNERCFVRLLGDMRAYNYVVDITPDIEGSQFRLRAIDFDQQCYEGRKNFYLPQFFKDNNPIVFLGTRYMNLETVRQYQLEERSLIAGRVKNSRSRLKSLFKIMVTDHLSEKSKIEQLRSELAVHHQHKEFLDCQTMGQIVLTNIQLLLKKDFKQSIVF